MYSSSSTGRISEPSVGSTGTATWVFDLDPGESVSVTFTVKVDDSAPASTVIENQGYFAPDNAPGYTSNPIKNPIDPKQVSVGDGTVVNAGQVMEYRL